MNQNIQTTIKYIINDYKRAFNDALTDLSTSILNDFRIIDLMINNLRLIKNFQINISFNNDFIKNLSITASKVIIVERNTLISSKIIVFKMFISVIFFRFNKSKID